MRRLVVACCTASAFFLLAGPAGAADCLRFLRGVDLQTATVPELQAAMASGRFSARDLVAASLARVAAFDTGGPRLNSVRVLASDALEVADRLDRERAAGRVRGPLHGIPVLLKDNIDTADLPTTAGSIALEGSIPREDATVVQKLRAAGAIVLGKANLSEFANWVDLRMPSGYSSLGGQVLNANDLDASPLGSSAGSAVAASMALAPVTLGSETSGSILSPSVVNGVVGLKPTLGLTSRHGVIPLSPQFDVVGPITRSVVDAAIVLSVIAGPDPLDAPTAEAPTGVDYAAALSPDPGAALRGVRLAFAPAAVDGLADDERAVWDAAVARLTAAGAVLVGTDTLEAGVAGASETPQIPNAFKASLNAYLQTVAPPTGVRTLSDIVAFNDQHPDKVKYGQSLLQASDATPGSADLAEAQAALTRAAAQEVIAAALSDTGAAAIVGPGFAHVNLGAAAGHPSVMVPSGYAGGGDAPNGIQVLGRRFDERGIVRIAAGIESVLRARVPPTDVNPKLAPGDCAAGGAGSSSLPRLRVTLRRGSRRTLVASVRGVVGTLVRVDVRRRSGRRSPLVRRLTAETRSGGATVRFRVRRPGRYRVTAVDGSRAAASRPVSLRSRGQS